MRTSGGSSRPRTALAAAARRAAPIAVVGALLLVGISFVRVAIAEYQLNQQKAALHADIARLQTENQALAAHYAGLATNAAVEKLAREQLGWTGPGETAVVVEWKDASPAMPKGPTVTLPSKEPIWHQWWDRFWGP